MKTNSYPISGDEQALFLRQLDNSLQTLAQVLDREKSTYRSEALDQFALANNWDMTRFPMQINTYKTLAQLVERVRQEYDWFSWRLDPNQPLENRGYFDKIEISVESGLPWIFNFIELGRLKKEASLLLERAPTYEKLSADLATILIEDYLSATETKEKTNQVQRQSLKRNFLEKLSSSKLICRETNSPGIFQARKVIPLGAEELWNINGIKFLPSYGMFELYIIDIWQDKIGDPHFREKDKEDEKTVSDKFVNSLQFGINNAPWFILRDIDERFPNLHPVHVSRALIGPFENKYRTNSKEISPLPITNELIDKDPNVSLLRFSRQYSYVPNHEEKDGVLRQIIHRETWSDEIIIAPAQYADKVNKTVLGTTVRVFETGGLEI